MIDPTVLDDAALASAAGGAMRLAPDTKQVLFGAGLTAAYWVGLDHLIKSPETWAAKTLNPSTCMGTWAEKGSLIDQIVCGTPK